jgi:hypothetical protein
MQNLNSFLLFFILPNSFIAIYYINKTIKSNRKYKKMQALLELYKKHLDDCVTMIDVIDPEIKFKTYMNQFSYPKADGYDGIMNEFEDHLHKTKFRIKYGKYKIKS